MRNPFIITRAVPPDLFFNREKEINMLKKILDSGSREVLICIVAPLKYGKTSLLYKYLEILESYDDIISIYIDLKIVSKPIKYIALKLEKILGKNIMEHYKKAKDEDLPEMFFEAISNALDEKWLFILFDEFQLLASKVRGEGFLKEASDDEIYAFFRGVSEHFNIRYIVCGSVIEPLINAIDVWGGRFRVIYLGPFKRRDSIKMLVKMFELGGVKISKEFADIIADSAGDHPFYMQLIGYELFRNSRFDLFGLREAKKSLFEYVKPIFDEMLNKILKVGKEALEILIKISKTDQYVPTTDEIEHVTKLLKMGILAQKNSGYYIVDKLFQRYISTIEISKSPSDVLIVGHWAERLVGNALVREGFQPYYSHDSKGAFDILVRVHEKYVGIQVKFSSKGEFYLTKDEAEKIKREAEELGWIPIIALVTDEIDYFPDIREGKYVKGMGFKKLIDAYNKALSRKI